MSVTEQTTDLQLRWDTNETFLNDSPCRIHMCSHSLWKKESSHNAVVVTLDANLKSSLNWEKELVQARDVVKSGLYIVWRFKFGLESANFSLTDSVPFETFKQTLHHFSSECAQEFQSATLGAIFYQGQSEFSKVFKTSPKLEQCFQDWLIDHELNNCSIEKKESAYPLFFADFFLSYLQMLSCEIPDSWTIFLPLTVSNSMSTAETFNYFSKERFEHFLLCLKGGTFPFPAICWAEGASRYGSYDCLNISQRAPSVSAVGLLFPSDVFHSDTAAQLDRIIQRLIEAKIDFRILYEKYAVEDWNEIDYLIFPYSRKDTTQRIAMGFNAAGGSIVFYEASLGVEGEQGFDEFIEKMVRGRGI